MLFTIRFTLLSVWFLIILIPSFIVCFLRPFHPSNTTFFGLAFGLLGKPIMGAKFVIEGKENLTNYLPCVFIANHQTNWDILVCAAITPRKTVSLGKDQLLKIPLFGIWYWLAGNILINRSNRKKALESMNRVTRTIVEKKTSILIMPEGTRSKGRGLLPFKKGAFMTAINAQVSVVPIVVSDFNNINFNKWRPGIVNIKILPGISTQGLNPEDANDLRDRCRTIVVNQLEEFKI